MARSDNVYALPADLPVPEDDGACDHLTGFTLPSIGLRSTRGDFVDISKLKGRVVVYIYPRTGRPDQELPTGWNAIPGARGCTPQSCGFRDHHAELASLGVQVFGLSTQTTEYQKEVVDRLHLPFEILSDADLKFTNALGLPTFTVDGMTLIKRTTLVLRDDQIEKVFYPVFPPDRSADEVIAWLNANPN